MDLNSSTRRRSPPSEDTDQQLAQNSKMQAKRFGSNGITFTQIFTYCLVALPIIFAISLIFRHPSSDRTMGFADARVLENREVKQNATPIGAGGSEGVLFQHADKYNGKLLGGLLADGFDEAACTSRYSSFLYRKISLHKPSSYLISRLRSYEDLHKRCGPNTQSYNKALEQLKSGNKIGLTDCNYIVWISFSGLGNRILSLASTFLYALLTNRVLLVDQGKDMADLLCDPFPDKSWLLPRDFPLIDQFDSFNQNSPHCHGNMLKNNAINSSAMSKPSYLYLHLVHDYGDHDKLFFWYSEDLRNMYWEHPTMTGEVVGVYQPSHEEFQQTEKQMHNRKAWAEMYLLSLTDVLVTSAWSTFGYVAQGLGGLRPWILYKTENDTAPDPPCRRAMSTEPCFHAPPFYDCKAKKGIDTGTLVPHVRHCEDISWGLKVVDDHDDL
ncbi:hypothetical protein D5086_016182 [Populus alba]|uniref:Uncharacterized protein n=1 Tax=Populus alba TaxID=43335 RepID=A0ACC4BU11_POPAL